MNPELLETLRTQIFTGFDEANVSDPQALDSSYDELVMQRRGVKEVPLREILTDSPTIVNFHFHCRILRVLSQQEPQGIGVTYPLESMQSEQSGLIFDAPALRVRLQGTGKVPSARFSKRGYLTLVGGGTSTEFKAYVLQACCIIINTLKSHYPDVGFTVGEFRINNKVASARAKGFFFLARLHDDLRAHNFRAHMPRGIGFLYVKKVFPREGIVTFSICASGKINIVGFRYDYQVIKALRLLAPFLKRSMVPPRST